MHLDIFLWGHVKSIVNATSVDTTEELTVQIHAAFKHNIDLKCSTESDTHCYGGVMNVIRFSVDALNTFCKLSAKGLEEINK
jgi:hypothetical protein